jgi:methyl-accepting chemotaxis protein
MTRQQQTQHPFNMVTSRYHYQPTVYQRTLQGQIGHSPSYNAGGVPKVDVYAPIPFAYGSYARHGVFGGVIVSTYLTTFQGAAAQAGAAINDRIAQLTTTISWIAVLAVVLIVALALMVSLSITRPLAHLTTAARAMGRGDFDKVQSASLGRQFVEDEVTELARVFKQMAERVQEREQNLRQEVADLHIQIDLQKQNSQVEEITGTDWFQYLSANARSMRSRYQNANTAEDGGGAEK